ncbi:MAG: DUF6364 family protein [Spirochaetaceae bacterium]|nr:DUF6364 family protein [Spirochaetaceae bacterium]
MPLAKLTLSVDPALVSVAKRLAAERGTSLSAMFSRLLHAIEQASTDPRPAPAPLTASVSGLVALPAGLTDEELLTEALVERSDSDG